MIRFIAEHRVKISPSTYYEWVAKQPTKRAVADAVLVEVIRGMRQDMKTGKFVQTLGARKLRLRLRGKGHDVARCTVEGIMREQGREGARYGSKHKTTVSDPTHGRRPDLVDRNFWALARTDSGWPTSVTCRPGPGWPTSRSWSTCSPEGSWGAAQPGR